MERFYISKIMVTGPEVEDSIIDFHDGVNIVHGPSNSGKSMLLKCIDFMLDGKKSPFDSVSYGYDTVSMTLSSSDGKEVVLERNLERHYPVTVTSNIPGIDSTKYKKADFDKLLLKIFNFESEHEIIKNENFGVQKLTYRSAYHNFYLDENRIISEDTPLRGNYSPTSDLTALYFMLTGDDLKILLPSMTEEERKKIITENDAIIKYLRGKISRLQERKRDIAETFGDASGQDIEKMIDAIFEEAAEADKKLEIAVKERSELIGRAYPLKMDLEEAEMLKKRYSVLESQYLSDIKRLDFILDGEGKISGIPAQHNCPFCGSELSEEHTDTETIAGAAIAEKKRINLQLNDLRDTRKNLDAHIEILSAQQKDLLKRHATLSDMIEKELMPKSISLKSMLDGYRQTLIERQKMASLQLMEEELNSDAKETEKAKPPTLPTFDVAAQFSSNDYWANLSDHFATLVKECGYPGDPVSYISTGGTWDAIVNGKYKKHEGKGYRAFLNTLLMFSVLTFLSEHGKYSPHLLLLDSPILSLKEPEAAISASMKEALFSCIISRCGANQIFIAENDIPDCSKVDYRNVNLIKFTKNKNEGQFGFLTSGTDSN